MWFGLAVGDVTLLLKNVKIIDSFPLILFPVSSFRAHFPLCHIHVENKPHFFFPAEYFLRNICRGDLPLNVTENVNRVRDIQLSFAALIQFHFS